MQMPGDLPCGAHLGAGGTTFVVHATRADEVLVRLFDGGGSALSESPLARTGTARFSVTLPSVTEGALYKFVLDGVELPDPYARFLPLGVHGPARVTRARREPGLERLSTRPPQAWSIYELHVGTFSPEGTYRGAIERLDHVAELGVSAIELMPLAAFDGQRGWGYDGVAAFAPFAPYGEPDDLRALVRAAHARGLAVLLDAVYNHFGPAGNYLAHYAPEYFTAKVTTPWGAAPAFDYEPMRRLVLGSAVYWLDAFGFDGLRLDATHHIHDATPRHIVAEIVERARPRLVFLEDERNDSSFVRSTRGAGVWADDFHHQLRVILTGERDGYYAGYERSLPALARCIEEGWLYTGQPYPFWDDRPRGKPRAPLHPEELVTCIENHDQAGNRAFGTRLSHDVDRGRYAVATMLLLFLPTTPLLFMGQEWAASSPFLFFSDHAAELGAKVSAGRREEFRLFDAFSAPDAAMAIPDPQAEATFARSKLRWDELGSAEHASLFALHRAMLTLRRTDAVLSAAADFGDVEASAIGSVLRVTRCRGAERRVLFANFGDEARPCEGELGRLLASCGGYADGTLAARSAAVFST
jgi:maltooligosyltrehalose trehalohydrolase